MHYNKLVRDHIPAILARLGRQSRTRQLDPDEFRVALREKLLEEAAECAAAESPKDIAEECADVLEVIAALAAASSIAWDDIMAVREQKARERGAFRERLLLIEAD
jgi:predicted house-cleaning noncanonical NTP pyrophosphatase (MazG superfamily)